MQLWIYLVTMTGIVIKFKGNKKYMVHNEVEPQETLQEQQHRSDGSELIPAEVAARTKREGSEPPNQPEAQIKQEQTAKSTTDTTAGYTVSGQGLVNNYPVTPKIREAEYPSEEQQKNYFVQGGLALFFVGLIVFIAFLVTRMS